MSRGSCHGLGHTHIYSALLCVHWAGFSSHTSVCSEVTPWSLSAAQASHDSATGREHSASPTALTPNTRVEQHHYLSWASISTPCPPPRRNWEPLMLLSSGHPLANCNIQPEAPDLHHQVQEERTEGEEGVEEM